MRILILSYCYPPANNPRALRWKALSQFFADQGHDVDVVHQGQVSEGVGCVEGLKGKLRVHPVAAWDHSIRSKAQLSTTIESASGSTPIGLGRALGGHPLRSIKALYNMTWKNIMWPDYACLWVPPAIEYAKALMSRHSFDAVISVSHPFSSHLVAWALRPKMTWLLDVGDPFAPFEGEPMNNLKLYRCWNFLAEKSLFSRADKISVTTQRTADVYARIWPEQAHKITVQAPLIEKPTRLWPRQMSKSRAKLVFVGTLYKNIRNPRHLLRFCSHLLEQGLEFDLHLYGESSRCAFELGAVPEKLKRCMRVHGVVSRKEALRAVREADILVNIGNTTSYQLPSKVIEYAASGLPILNFTTHPEDSSAQALSGYPLCRSIYKNNWNSEDAETLSQWIQKRPRLSQLQVDTWCAPYLLEVVGAQYVDLLEGVKMPQQVA